MEGRLNLVAFAVLVSAICLAQGQYQCNPVGPRKDCGYYGISTTECQSKGCCYVPAPPSTGAAFLNLPVCFYKNNGASSYTLSSGPQSSNGAQQYKLTQQSSAQPEFGPDVASLDMNVSYITPNIMRVKIGAPGRWEFPMSLLNTTVKPGSATPPSNASYAFDTTASPFSFTVSRAGSNSDAPLFTTKGNRFVFKDQYLEITSTIPNSASLYGVGEHIFSSGLLLRRDGAPMALWSRDNAASEPDQNTYGAWPFVLDIRAGGAAHGVLLMNSNGMDITLTDTQLSYRVTGGVLDFYFFMGPTPHAVLEQLTYIVGRPFMPPYWSLGLMNSKYGYASVKQITRVVQSYAYAKIPLETFVTDSQYMDHDQDFTFSDDYTPSEMQGFVSMLSKNGQRWVPILDPPIHIKQSYAAFDSGNAANVWVTGIDGKPYAGQLWPGATYWPDFMKQGTVDWWQSQIQSVYKTVPLDGIWLDMNEVSNYCSGDICTDPGNVPAANDFICKLTCQWGPDNTNTKVKPGIFLPPYPINNANYQMNLSAKTLAVTSQHYDGTLEYDVHNLYGLYESKATAEALQNIRQRRHFQFTRSSFVGSGAYTAHWTGDSASTWQDLRWQVPAVMAPGLVGISFSGADICGFQNIATEELCARWIAVGAWQPLARVHHAQSFQELYRWPAVAEVSRKVLGWRLRAMPYLYTAFHNSHTYGCPIAQPLFFAFPADSGTYNLKEQWLMGDALHVTPILHRGQNSTVAYFPAGLWYNLYNYTLIDTTDGGKNVTVEANITDNTPIHVLGGNILPLARGGVMTTAAARAAPLTLLVALGRSPQGTTAVGSVPQQCSRPCRVQQGADLQACGRMYLDGGDELYVGSARDNMLAFDSQVAGADGAAKGQVRLTWPGAASCSGSIAWPVLEGITVLGAPAVDPATITLQRTVNGTTTPSTGFNGSLVEYDSSTARLSVAGLNYTITCPEELTISWAAPATQRRVEG